ncbi:ATP-dependent nuclease [Halovulum sp. GXIMD14794]
MQEDGKSNSDHEGSTEKSEPPFEGLVEVLPSEFESEVPPEDYHKSRQKDAAQGKFIEVRATNWAHEEVDWSIGDLDAGAEFVVADFDDQTAEPDQDILTAHQETVSSRPKKIRKTRKDSATIDEHIASIQLKNFKKFRSFRVDCGVTNILTGRNNAGKSSILDALRVAHDVLKFAFRRKPEISEFEGRNCASFTLATSALKIPIDNITWNYSNEPASVRISLRNGAQFVILLHPDRPIRAFLISDGPLPRTISAFRRLFPLTLVVVPTLGPVEENEQYLTDKTISGSENTRTAHRHLRNILIRKPDDEFHEFSEEVSSAWPEITLERPRVVGHGEPMEMMFFEDRIPREIFWSGFGLQVWMQMVLQFMRGSDNCVLVLDEPDIYLHPELQIRMVELAARKFGQVFIATHSPTIIEIAGAEDVLTISAKEGSASRGERTSNQ